MDAPILDDLKVFVSEVDGQRVSEKLWYIPAAKCLEINGKLLMKEVFSEDYLGHVDESCFFNLDLLRALSDVLTLAWVDEKKLVFKVDPNNDFFSLEKEGQLDELFFAFFVALDKTILYPFDCPVERLLNDKAKFVADYLFKNAGNRIVTRELAKKIAEGEKFELSQDTVLFHANFCVEKIFFKALKYFGAVKPKGKNAVVVTEQGKTLLSNLLNSPRFGKLESRALNKIVKLPLISLLEPSTDIPKLRKIQSDSEKFFKDYEGFFLAIESVILSEYTENRGLLDNDVLEVLNHMKENMQDETDIPKLEKKIRIILKLNVATKKAEQKTALSVPELRAVITRIIHWVKNHSDEGKQGYLNYLEAFMQEKLETEEDTPEYLKKIGYRSK